MQLADIVGVNGINQRGFLESLEEKNSWSD